MNLELALYCGQRMPAGPGLDRLFDRRILKFLATVVINHWVGIDKGSNMGSLRVHVCTHTPEFVFFYTYLVF